MDGLRMAVSHLRRGVTGQATIGLFARNLPPGRGSLVAAGLDDTLQLLHSFRFEPEERRYGRDGLRVPATDVEVRSRLWFTRDVRAVPEGRVVFAGEPLPAVTAARPEARLVETRLLNTVTFATAIAATAARSRLAAPHADLIGFSARRAHGGDPVLASARPLTGFTAPGRCGSLRRADRDGGRGGRRNGR